MGDPPVTEMAEGVEPGGSPGGLLVAELPPDPPVAQPPAVERPISGWRLPPEMDATWQSRRWPRRHWRPLLGLGIVAALVISMVVVGVQFFSLVSTLTRAELDLIGGSRGRITRVNFVTINGRTSFQIYAAPGVSELAGVDLACQVVRPILARDGYSNAPFQVLDRAGDVIAPTGRIAPTRGLPPRPTRSRDAAERPAS